MVKASPVAKQKKNICYFLMLFVKNKKPKSIHVRILRYHNYSHTQQMHIIKKPPVLIRSVPLQGCLDSYHAVQYTQVIRTEVDHMQQSVCRDFQA